MPRPPSPLLRRLRRLAWAIGLATVVVGAGTVAHRPLLVGFARLFRVDDPAPSDALIVLLGGPDHRPAKAAALYREGVAPLILAADSSVNSLLGESETDRVRRILIGQGVPADAFRVLPGAITTSTRDEALRVLDYARAHPSIRRITVVTTAFHTARARWIFRKALRGTGIDVRMAAARQPGLDESDWFTHDEGLVVYFGEALKTLYYRLAY